MNSIVEGEREPLNRQATRVAAGGNAYASMLDLPGPGIGPQRPRPAVSASFNVGWDRVLLQTQTYNLPGMRRSIVDSIYMEAYR